MKRYQLALAVKEQEYIKRFADYVRESPFGEQWQVTAFTHADACKRYLEQGYKIDLLAIQPDLLLEMQDGLPNIPIVSLVMKHGRGQAGQELLQFQPLPSLLQHLAEVYNRSSKKQAHTAAREDAVSSVKVISIYSASGGVGKTSLSLHLVHAAGSQQYRTFYLNLERWNSTDVWLGKTAAEGASSDGLSELLYGLKSQPELAGRWISEHRRRHPLLKADYLSPCSNLEDRMTLGPDDAAGLIKAISQSGLYDLIVIDLDDGIDELHMAMLELSDQVLLLLHDNPSAQHKQRLAMQYGEQKWGERFARQLWKCKGVRSRVSQEAIMSQLELSGVEVLPLSLPEVAEWRNKAGVVLLSSPIYRAAVEKIFKHIEQEGGVLVANG